MWLSGDRYVDHAVYISVCSNLASLLFFFFFKISIIRVNTNSRNSNAIATNTNIAYHCDVDTREQRKERTPSYAFFSLDF
jgi:hypothetical protein